MKAETIYRKLKNIRGTMTTAAWGKVIPCLQSVETGVIVEKITVAHVRAGIEFENLGSVQNGIEDGTRGEVPRDNMGKVVIV